MHFYREILKQNHFSDEYVVEIDRSLSFDLLCREDRQKETNHGIIPTEVEKSTLGKGFGGCKNLEDERQLCKEIQGLINRQESGTSFTAATVVESSPSTPAIVAKIRCNASLYLFKLAESKKYEGLFFCTLV